MRTDKGYIFKVDEEKKNLQIANFLDVEYGKMIKHSKQLIDLIECGDYVNGHLVEEVRISCFDSSIFVHEYAIELHENDIKTILTKEQFEANCYKVGGEDEKI